MIDLTNCSPIPGIEKIFSMTIEPVINATVYGPIKVTNGIKLLRKA